MSSNKAPLFTGESYAFWRIRMKSYLEAFGFGIWQSIVDGYKTAEKAPSTADEKKLSENNVRAINAMLGGLAHFVFTKVMHCKSSKEIWDKLEIIYKGDAKVKETKLQLYKK